jgi:hypothetical protein
LTELGFAEKRWPAAKGAIWPVIVDPSVDAAELPSYLRAVQVHVPKGNVVADLAAEIDGSRTVRSSCLLAALALIALPVIAAGVVSNARYASYALVPPRQVVFLPTKKPGPDESWMTSPVALTVVPVSYNNDGRRDVRIVSETVRLPVGERTVAFKWFNEVDLKPNCGAEWLCVKGPVGAGTLPAQGTLLRETMFTPAPGQTLTWRDFVGFVCGGTGDTLAVSLSSETRASTLLGTKTDIRETSCRLDLKAMRESLQRKGCKEPGAALPIRLPRNCLP